MAVAQASGTQKPASQHASGRSYRRTETIAGYLFLTPYLLTTLVFLVGALIYAFYLSFTDARLLEQGAPPWIGLGNYQLILQDPQFRHAVLNTVYYTVVVVTFQTVLAILLAVLLNAPLKARAFFRAAFYAPSVTSSVAISLIFLWLYLKNGWLNYILHFFGIPQIDWLGNTKTALPAIMAMNIFTTAPTFMIIFLAALQDIPTQVYEAAKIDGASTVQTFFRITLPLLRPTIALVTIVGTIGAMQIFDQAYMMTNGGPLDSTLTIVLLLYHAGFTSPYYAGYAAAIGFVLFAIIFVLSLVQRRFFESNVQY